MAMRMSGLMSGMDTESIVQQLVEVRSAKVTKTKNEQTKLEWKQDIWKDLNKKLKSLQSKLNNLRFTGDYVKKKTSVSDSSVASVMTSGTAVDSVQSLEVNQLAKTAYLTGGKVGMREGVTGDVSALTPMQFLMDFSSENEQKTITLHKANGDSVDIELNYSTSISDVLNKFKEEGLNASFDANQKRFFISAKEPGENQDFMITGDRKALDALGLNVNRTSEFNSRGGSRVTGSTRLNQIVASTTDFPQTLTVKRADGSVAASFQVNGNTTVDDLVDLMNNAGMKTVFDARHGNGTLYVENNGMTVGGDTNLLLDLRLFDAPGVLAPAPADASFIKGQDAKIKLNGAEFTSANNVFEINGLTITTLNTTDPGKSITLTTKQDTDGIYDMIKDFLKTYNDIINEMDKLYNEKAAKDYEPLTDEQKAKMSESEIEKYEQKIKDALLRKDSNLGTVSSALKEVMLSGFMVNGQKMFLTHFGIETLNYFNAPDNEKNAFHINGDSDDEYTSANEDKLKKMIATDPDAVVSFFTQLTMKMYNKMNDMSKSVEGYRSYGSFFDDKKMKSDYADYTSKIKTQEEKLADYEDKWYKKFSKMETAMAKMQKNVNALTGMLGNNN